MRVGIIGAMELEIAALKNIMGDFDCREFAGMEFFVGSICDKDVVVVRCGVGKVNAAVCTQVLADRFDVTHLINIGVAGALSPKLTVGDIVICADALQHDMDASLLGFAKGEIPYMGKATFDADHDMRRLAVTAAAKVCRNLTVMEGRVLSGDQFIAAKETKDKLLREFQGDCTEMEGASVAQVAHINNIPFLIIRAISDQADGNGKQSFEEFAPQAAANVTRLTEKLLELM